MGSGWARAKGGVQHGETPTTPREGPRASPAARPAPPGPDNGGGASSPSCGGRSGRRRPGALGRSGGAGPAGHDRPGGRGEPAGEGELRRPVGALVPVGLLDPGPHREGGGHPLTVPNAGQPDTASAGWGQSGPVWFWGRVRADRPDRRLRDDQQGVHGAARAAPVLPGAELLVHDGGDRLGMSEGPRAAAQAHQRGSRTRWSRGAWCPRSTVTPCRPCASTSGSRRGSSPSRRTTCSRRSAWRTPTRAPFQGVNDGFYVLVAAAPPGAHTIVFGGTIKDPDFVFTLHVSYAITVA